MVFAGLLSNMQSSEAAQRILMLGVRVRARGWVCAAERCLLSVLQVTSHARAVA
jgi:hypothetical protein